MLLQAWRKLRRQTQGKNHKHSTTRTFRPRLEGLEDRLAPATFAVATSGTDAPGFGSAAAPFRTIQFAVNQATSGDTILVASGTYTYNPNADVCSPQPPNGIGDTGAVCVINKQLIILGGFAAGNFSTSNPTANPTVIDGGGIVRGVMATSTGAPSALRLEGFTIRNGVARPPQNQFLTGDNRIFAFGGGIFVDAASSELRNLVIENNQAIGSDTNTSHGGAGSGGGLAIRNTPGGINNIVENVTFTGNAARGGSGANRGGYAIGGAFFAFQSNVTFNGATFTSNGAFSGNTAGSGSDNLGEFGDALGGAVAVGTGANVVFQNITASNNTAQGGTAPNGDGGGAFAGAMYAELGNMTIRDSNIRGNNALGGNGVNNSPQGGIAEGGGIMSIHSNVVVDRTQVIGNTARGGAGQTFMGTVGGGGIAFARLTGNTTITVTNSIIANNSAQMGGGSNNSRGGGGGGVFLQGVDATFTHVTLAQNTNSNVAMQGQSILLLRIGAATQTVLNLSHSIIADYQNSFGHAALHAQPDNTVNINRVLFANNAKDTNANGIPLPGGVFNGTGSIINAQSAGFISAGAPNFNYHIGQNSAAVNQGIGSTATVDFENQARTDTPDLGADEQGSPSQPPPVQVNPNENTGFLDALFQQLLGRHVDDGALGFFQPPLDNGLFGQLPIPALNIVISPEARGKMVRSFYQELLRRNASDGEVAFWVSGLNNTATPEQIQALFAASAEYFQKAGNTNSGWLDRIYQDLLGRARDASSQTFLNGLNAGTFTLLQVATIIVGSEEYRNNFIRDTYQDFLGRQPSAGDLNFWRTELNAPHFGVGQPSPAEFVIIRIAASQESFRKNGNTMVGYVTALYQKVLERDPDAGGLNFFVGTMLNGYIANRTQSALSVITAPEHRAQQVRHYYSTYLRRSAGDAELSFWVGQFAAGRTEEQVIADIVGSPEYFNRAGGNNTAFLNQLYTDVLKRQRSAGETFFLEILNAGTANRTQVALAILGAVEYKALVVRDYYQNFLRRPASEGDVNFWVSVLQSTRNENVLATILGTTEYFLAPHD